MHPAESRYNHLHSKTRIAVEGAFGSLKNRFRVLKAPLPHKPKMAAKIIQFCLTLHNILIDFKDSVLIINIDEIEDADEPEVEEHDVLFGDEAKLKRNNMKDYLLGIV
jgi:hypothetical protein